LIVLAYIIQIQSAAWYVKFVDFMFGVQKAKLKKAPETQIIEKPIDLKFEKNTSMIIDVKKILFATDLSESSRHAVKYACSIGNKYNAQVHAIMGTHGHGQFEEMMVGSTASGVILKSKVPVLVARPS